MPAKEIKELRQSGKLEEALIIAQEELDAQPDNIWGKRNISWVYYEYIKRNVAASNFEGFIDNLTKLKELNLPQEEIMVFDTTAWQIGSMVFKLQAAETIDYSKINKVFDLVKGFHLTKPSESYSLLYKAFHKGYKNWSRFIEFADWWNFENFKKEDYDKTVYNDRETMALADQAYIAYSKKLLEGQPLDAFGAIREVDKDKIKLFMPKLDKIISDHPEYQYPPYFKAKLLLAIGDGDNVLSAFLPFAKQQRNDFWVWDLMAEIFENDEKVQFASYCKALSLRAPKEFLVKTRQKFAELLIKGKHYKEAKTEIQKIISIREEHGWKISNQLSDWMQSDWYANTESQASNKQLYAKHSMEADEILFQDTPESCIAVEFVNHDKNVINFVSDHSLHGFFKYKGLNIKPEIGDVYKVRLQPFGNEGFYKALTIKEVAKDEYQECKAIKQVTGSIRINDGQNFGFLEDVFITPGHIENGSLKNQDEITCNAIQSFNKKKNEWGWKCFKILKY
ncbi:tetratricopeptide repeat protein [Winogradskyella sp. UBA3174]|uniref:tetratricopeptide repeat protein n=1 Tax=Winogradskyella sp. UBA3174 TaxID=1947785 RepID=UPI0025CF80D4|nr:hypothetical protein [Winogradskyella sp. UBA3174]|tara:strand:- start:105320 stop:106843 length:1524 start_codon:yes stop_codon:yes gene_type:complete